MKIGALARSLGVPIPTLRRWTQEFADGLTEQARGGDGRPREFVTRDQRLLRRVREILTDRSVTYAQARRQLVDEQLIPAPAAQSADTSPETASAEERAAAERFVLALVEQATRGWVSRIENLEREVAQLHRQIEEATVPVDSPDTSSTPTRRRWPFG